LKFWADCPAYPDRREALQSMLGSGALRPVAIDDIATLELFVELVEESWDLERRHAWVSR
jgi:hypothetical protein